MRTILGTTALFLVVGCGPKPDRVELALAPDLISSEIGVISARATVFANKDTVSDYKVEFDVAYKDRSGTAINIPAVTDTGNAAGEASASFSGLMFEGSGTVTAKVMDMQGMAVVDDMSNPIQAAATFGVLDQSPPKVTITSPVNGAHLAMNTPYTITVHATDEIGISQVFTQTTRMNGGNGGSNRITSGAADVTISVDTDTGGNGTNTITIYAMAADLSGNLGIAAPIVINVP